MNNQVGFELHSCDTAATPAATADNDDIRALMESLPWRAGQQAQRSVLAIPGGGEPACVIWNPAQRCLELCEDPAASIAEFRVIPRQFSPALAFVPRDSGVLVNGLPPLSLTMLQPRDVLRLAAGVHTFVTQRIRPYVGPPPAELVGTKCPSCRIPVAEDSQVYVHRCGVPYHLETEDTHPQLAAEDRLDCFHNVRTCLSCNREMTLAETLAWDPTTAM
jgi:hypothetical protein